ncbi:MAG: LytTR family DNA-binding domain-containing protein [Bacteroidales bacterium]
MNALIIEDEPHAQNELKRLLEKSKHTVSVIDCIDSIVDTVEWFSENKSPDLLFLDIQLSDGLSFDIFNKVQVKCPVIFTTAFDEYAIRAFKVNSIDYLLKPIKSDDLENALDKLDSIKSSYESKEVTISQEQINELLQYRKPNYKTRFIARVGDQIKHIDIMDVAYFMAEDNEVMLITKNNNKYIIDYSLDELGSLLNPDNFFRANRSYIVALQSISKINKYFNSRLHLTLSPETEDTVLISRVKVPEFLKWMDK